MRQPFDAVRFWRRVILFTGWLTAGYVWAQEIGNPFIRNYSPREYKASSANYQVVQDRRGVMFFANYRGVLEYDGDTWRLIPMPTGSMVFSVAADSMGNVYAGGMGDFGYLSPDASGLLAFKSLIFKQGPPRLSAADLVEVFGLKNGAWFVPVGQSMVYLWEHGRLKHFRLEDPHDRLFFFNHSLVYQLSPGLWKSWRNGKTWVWKGEGQAARAETEAWIQLQKDTALVKVKGGGLKKAVVKDGKIQFLPFSAEVDKWLSSRSFTRIQQLGNGYVMVAALDEGALLVNQAGKITFHLNESHGLQDNLITNGRFDGQQSLWLTLSKGISRVEVASPLTQWRESSGLRGIVFSALRHEGTLYAATTLGLFRLENGRFVQDPVISEETHQLKLITLKLPNGREEKRMLVYSISGIYEVFRNSVKPLLKGQNVLDIAVSRFHPNRVYFSTVDHRLWMMEFAANRWQAPVIIDGLEDRYAQLTEDDNGHLWMSEVLGKPAVVRLVFEHPGQKTPTRMLRYEDAKFPPVNDIARLQTGLIFLTEEGPFRFDTRQGGFVPDNVLSSYLDGGLARILRVAQDHSGNLWLERQRNQERWIELARPDGNGGFVRDSVHLRSLSDLEVWSDIYVEDNGVAWIGTPEGLYRYDGGLERSAFARFAPLIRKVVAQPDSVLFGGAFPGADTTAGLMIGHVQGKEKVVKLPYSMNSLTFYCSAPFYEDEGEVRFSFFLKGYDTNWSAYTHERKREYTLLPPGKYSFQVKALTPYDQSTSIVAFDFVIRPPWYFTYWAFIGYGLALGLLIYGLIKLNTRRLKLQNENLEKLVFERTAEIWEQNKEIVKKTVALKRQKEEIAEKGALLEEKNKALEATVEQLQSTQLKLVESEKMASLGQLTAGIAHEINNPINYVKGNISPLKRDFDEIRQLFDKILKVKEADADETCVGEIRKAIEEADAEFLFVEMAQLLAGIEEGAVRTKDIVDGLRDFSRAESTTFKEGDIHQGLEATLTLLEHALKDRIRVVKDYGDLPKVDCLPGKLNQVFMNVLNNAVQALEEHRTHQPAGFEPVIRIQTRQKDDWVEIRIADNGPGMPQEVKDKIFEPFFTTKDVGKGTGLGLSISFGIIEQHRGHIQVITGPGKGSEFVITIPVDQPQVVSSPVTNG
jgi:signal transduction histidine kinase